MSRPALLAPLLLVGLAACTPTLPDWATTVGSVRVQEGDDPRWAGAGWDDSRWQRTHWARVSSHDRIVWLRARVGHATLPADGDVAVTVSAVGAYEVFWNGTRIGGSGRPGPSRALEVPGPMTSTSAAHAVDTTGVSQAIDSASVSPKPSPPVVVT